MELERLQVGLLEGVLEGLGHLVAVGSCLPAAGGGGDDLGDVVLLLLDQLPFLKLTLGIFSVGKILVMVISLLATYRYSLLCLLVSKILSVGGDLLGRVPGRRCRA